MFVLLAFATCFLAVQLLRSRRHVHTRPSVWPLPRERFGAWRVGGWQPGGFLAVVVYLISGKEDGEENLRFLHLLGMTLRAANLPYIVMADWQMPPQTLRDTGWTEALSGRIWAPGIPTCYMACSAREIEYFVMDGRSALLLEKT